MDYPLTSYLQTGITAKQAKDLLQQHDCLAFPQLKSGLFPAANFDNLASDETGMADAWLRDSAFVGLMMLKIGNRELATAAVQGVIRCLHSVRDDIDAVLSAGKLTDQTTRPPVRFTGQDSLPKREWANAQNDALGYGLQLIGAAAEAKIFEVDSDDVLLIDALIRYLYVIEYWQDADSGHWEEVPKVNASSVGSVLSGLVAVQSLATKHDLVAELIDRGTEVLAELLPNESTTEGMARANDSALIFLVEPQQLIDGESASEIIDNTADMLLGERGFRRYNGDSYWGPDYREHFMTGDRAADFSDPQNMALRDGYLTAGGEAQWTFFDPMISAYYAHKYQLSNSETDASLATKFMARSLSSIVTHEKPGVGTVWRLPELFFLEKGEWLPNDHLGLLWGQANLLYALHVFESVFGDKLITK